MKSKLAILTCAALLILSNTTLKADTVLGGSQAGEFGTLDLNTGVYTILGTPGVTLAGMALVNGTLYGADFNLPVSNLYRINPADGSLTVIGSSSVNYDDFGETTGGLFAVGTDTNLYSIDPATGAATAIGPTGIAVTGSRSLSNNSATLYFADDATLYTINTSTGAATAVGLMGGPQFDAIIFENGILYGASSDSLPFRVDTIDPITGQATAGPVITGTTTDFFGLAPIPSAVPEPGAVVLLGTAISALALLKRRSGPNKA